jgi:serine/threonine protein kinase
VSESQTELSKKLVIVEADLLSLKTSAKPVLSSDPGMQTDQTFRWLTSMRNHRPWLRGLRFRIVCLWLSRFVTSPTRFNIGPQISESPYSKSYRATDTLTGKEVCLAIFETDLDEREPLDRLRELMTLSENDHPAAQKLISFSFDSTSNVPNQIVTELFPNGDLESALKKERTGKGVTLNSTTKSKLIFGIVSVMGSLPARGILHRDLKPQNVFLTEQFEPVIGGFHCSRPYDGGLNLSGGIGSPYFLAPETYADDTYDFSVDVYSFAVTLYSIFAEPTTLDDNRRPFKSPQQRMMEIAKGARYIKRPEIPEYHWGVIVRCWQHDPEKRPTFQALLKEFHESHEYILPGSDRSAVVEYENRVGSAVEAPNTGRLREDYSNQ